MNELKNLVGKDLMVTVITASPKEEKLIFSEKHTESEELKGLVSKYKVGDIIEGPVTGVVDFGIFIKLEEGLEGLAHISELDWSLVENPGSLFSVGNTVKAKVIGVEGGRVSLSVKALIPDPWTEVKDQFKKGDIIEAEVLRFNPYGALVCVAKGVCGLVHISEFKSEDDMKIKLALGKKLPFQIMLFEPADHKLTFSFLQEGVEAAKEEEKKAAE
ncbi:MAG: S1 RNA-binding domain-containing protein [Candidatus Niyogibacteria bacterium]|nr:S1 RNA-binding domain-containing protein [Candidatus Niyogibacteria bacterium]